MRSAVLLACAAACDPHREAPAPPPAVPAALRELPDPHTVEWRDAMLEIDELGAVKLSGGHAEFRIAATETGHVHVLPQGVREDGDWPGALDVDAPLFVDLDGDGHDEAVLRFALHSTQLEAASGGAFGALVYALRDGRPVKLATIGAGAEPRDFRISAHAITADGRTWVWDASQQRVVER